MKKHFVRAALAASLLCTTAGAMVWSTTAYAAGYGGGDDTQDKSSSKPPAITNKDIAKALQEAQKDLKANDLAGAAAAVKTAQAVANPTPIETYYINKFVAAIAISNKDYAGATTAYQANADSPVMPDEDKKEVFHNAILLTSMVKDWPKVITYGKELEAINGLDYQTDGVIGLAYYNLKDMANAKIYAQKSVDAAKAAGKDAPETSMEIIMGAEANSHDQGAAVATLEQIAVQYNRPDDWRQLTNIGLGAKGIKYIDALYIYRLKAIANCLTEPDDYTVPAQVDIQLGYPTEAIKFYEAGVSAGKVKPGDLQGLAKARRDAAQDQNSLSMLAASAARSKTGEQDVKMAEDYWGYGRYADAETAARAAIAKGGLKDPGEGQMILGMALVAQGKYDDAIQTLGQVTGNDGRTKAAHLWSLYAQAKKKQASGAAAPAPAPAQQPPAH